MPDFPICGSNAADIYECLIMRRAITGHRADYVLLGAFFIVLVFGLVMLTSASSPAGQEKFQDVYFFIKRQLLFGLIPGALFFLFFSRFYYQKLRLLGNWIFLFAIILLLLVFIPGIGTSFGTGNRSWINLFGASFQPAEFAKIVLIIFLSCLLVKKGQEIRDFKSGFLPVAGLGLIPLVLVILQPDIGTLAILFVILFVLLFVGGARLSHLGILAAGGLIALILVIVVAPYRTARLVTFLHPELDPQGIGYHISQAFLAIGSGGFWGRGLGHSLQKFQYLPEVSADSIYAVIAEEMGFVFAVGLILLLLFIAGRGLILAKNVPDQFGRLLVSGIIAWLVFQSFLNIGGIAGVFPLTGVPLPLVSHGGTALAVALAGIGIIANVSKYSE